MNPMINRQKLIEELNSYHYTAIGMRCGKKVTAEIINGYHDHVIEVIESQPPADQWIPCSERLPNNYDTCLITTGCFGEFVMMAYFDPLESEDWHYNDDDGWTHRIGNVTAWMPLPKPYKGVE